MRTDQNILVIRFSSIGDIVLATSPLKTIRTAWPEANLTFLTLDAFSPMLEFHPDIDAMISLRRSLSLKELWEFSAYVKEKAYNRIYDLHNSLRSRIVTLKTDSPIHRIEKPRWNRFMLYQFHQNNFPDDFSTRLNYHQHLGEIWASDLGLPPTNLVVSGHEKSEAKKRLSKLKVARDYVAVVPGAAWAQKQWSVDRYADAIEKIKYGLGMDSIILGSQKDNICFEISKKSSGVNLAGKTDLRQAMAVLANAKHIIGSDTGLVHAAEALGVPVSMVLGPTSSETGGGVSLEISGNVERDLWCRPCSQNGKNPCYRSSQNCMESISVNDVIESIPGQQVF